MVSVVPPAGTLVSVIGAQLRLLIYCFGELHWKIRKHCLLLKRKRTGLANYMTVLATRYLKTTMSADTASTRNDTSLATQDLSNYFGKCVQLYHPVLLLLLLAHVSVSSETSSSALWMRFAALLTSRRRKLVSSTLCFSSC